MHRLHLRQSAQPHAEIHAHAFGIQRRPVRIESRICIRLDRRPDAKVRKTPKLLHVLLRQRLRHRFAPRTAGVQGRRQEPRRVKVLHLARDPCRAARRVKSRDRANSAAARDERGPRVRRGVSAGCDRANARDDHATTRWGDK